MVVCFIDYRICGLQYNRSTMTQLYARANIYKSVHWSFQKEQELSKQVLNQQRFYEPNLQK